MSIRRAFVVAMAAALGLAAGCSGKSGTVAAAGGGVASDAGTAQAVQQRIQADPGMAGAQVKVGTSAGTITLDGTVKSVAQKDKAEGHVRAVQQQKHQQEGVFDNLMVQESGSAAQGETGGGR